MCLRGVGFDASAPPATCTTSPGGVLQASVTMALDGAEVYGAKVMCHACGACLTDDEVRALVGRASYEESRQVRLVNQCRAVAGIGSLPPPAWKHVLVVASGQSWYLVGGGGKPPDAPAHSLTHCMFLTPTSASALRPQTPRQPINLQPPRTRV